MTYYKIIDNYRWDGLVRDLRRQLGNKTKNDALSYKDESDFEKAWDKIHGKELSNLEDAFKSTPDLSSAVRGIILERFESTFYGQ